MRGLCEEVANVERVSKQRSSKFRSRLKHGMGGVLCLAGGDGCGDGSANHESEADVTAPSSRRTRLLADDEDGLGIRSCQRLCCGMYIYTHGRALEHP
jgi:hypothetical protein